MVVGTLLNCHGCCPLDVSSDTHQNSDSRRRVLVHRKAVQRAKHLGKRERSGQGGDVGARALNKSSGLEWSGVKWMAGMAGTPFVVSAVSGRGKMVIDGGGGGNIRDQVSNVEALKAALKR